MEIKYMLLAGACHVICFRTREVRLFIGSYICGLSPGGECLSSEEPMSGSAGEVTGDGEDVVGGCMHREEALRRARLFESLHLPLSSSDRDMRAFQHGC
jgi:hypothetical protein